MGFNLFSNMNLNKKLTLSFLALALIPVTIVTFIVETSTYSDRITQINDHNTYTATLKMDTMQGMLMSQTATMSTIVASDDVRSLEKDRMEASLKAMVRNSPQVANAFICDINGQQIARDSGNYVNVKDRDYIKAVMTGGKSAAYSDAILSKATNKVVVIAAVPVKNAQGQIIGAMASTFNMDIIEAMLGAYVGNLEDRDEILYITDSKGNVMVHPNKKYTENLTNWSTSEPVQAALSGKTGAVEYENADGVTSLAASSPFPEIGWTIVVENPKSQVTASIYKSIMFVAIVCIALLLLAAVFARLMTRSFVAPLEELKEKTILMANGDLRVHLNVNRNDEIGHVARAFNEMLTQLRDVMGKITTASQQVAAGSRNISDSGNMLAKGAATQASSVEELSSSISEITAQTANNAENAEKANELTTNVKTEAETGNEQMTLMLTAMEEINESSANISKIIKTIEEIAFQTNILALNAAVEAARAGQYGKGFAVVAEEVRNLAARSAKAAKETTDIIEASFDKVNRGTELAHETAAALKEIRNGVTTVAGLVSEIADASVKQNSALQMLNQGVLQVSNVVQTNSSTAEESAAASVELSAQANLLQEAVNRFKV